MSAPADLEAPAADPSPHSSPGQNEATLRQRAAVQGLVGSSSLGRGDSPNDSRTAGHSDSEVAASAQNGKKAYNLKPLDGNSSASAAAQGGRPRQSPKEHLADHAGVQSSFPCFPGDRAWGERSWLYEFMPFRGMYYDVRRRLPFYASDWTSAFLPKNWWTILQSIPRLYFINLMPAIAYLLDLTHRTNGAYGINEVIIVTALPLVVFSIFSAQPLTIVGFTGLTNLVCYTQYTIVVDHYGLSQLDYLRVQAWAFIWAAGFHFIAALFNLCDFSRFITDMTSATFGFYVGIVYIQKGIEILILEFEPAPLDNATGWLSVVVAMLFVISVYLVSKVANTSALPFKLRSFVGAFAFAAGCLVWTGFTHFPENSLRRVPLERLPITKSFFPTLNRSWFIDFWNIELRWVFVGAGFGFGIFLLFWFDHNVSSIMAQGRQFPLKRPAGFHWDFFLLGVTTLVSGFLGLPAPNGLVPQCPWHTDSLSVYKQVDPDAATENEEKDPKATSRQRRAPATIVNTRVVEQRVSHLIVGLLTVGTATRPLLVALGTMPRAVFAGIFILVGWASIEDNIITTRTLALLRDDAMADPKDPLLKVRKSKIFLFVAIQWLFFAMTFAISQTVAAIGFPVIIILLIPFRYYLVPRWFSPAELKILDAPTADSDVVLASIGHSFGVTGAGERVARDTGIAGELWDGSEFDDDEYAEFGGSRFNKSRRDLYDSEGAEGATAYTIGDEDEGDLPPRIETPFPGRAPSPFHWYRPQTPLTPQFDARGGQESSESQDDVAPLAHAPPSSTVPAAIPRTWFSPKKSSTEKATASASEPALSQNNRSPIEPVNAPPILAAPPIGGGETLDAEILSALSNGDAEPAPEPSTAPAVLAAPPVSSIAGKGSTQVVDASAESTAQSGPTAPQALAADAAITGASGVGTANIAKSVTSDKASTKQDKKARKAAEKAEKEEQKRLKREAQRKAAEETQALANQRLLAAQQAAAETQARAEKLKTDQQRAEEAAEADRLRQRQEREAAEQLARESKELERRNSKLKRSESKKASKAAAQTAAAAAAGSATLHELVEEHEQQEAAKAAQAERDEKHARDHDKAEAELRAKEEADKAAAAAAGGAALEHLALQVKHDSEQEAEKEAKAAEEKQKAESAAALAGGDALAKLASKVKHDTEKERKHDDEAVAAAAEALDEIVKRHERERAELSERKQREHEEAASKGADALAALVAKHKEDSEAEARAEQERAQREQEAREKNEKARDAQKAAAAAAGGGALAELIAARQKEEQDAAERAKEIHELEQRAAAAAIAQRKAEEAKRKERETQEKEAAELAARQRQMLAEKEEKQRLRDEQDKAAALAEEKRKAEEEAAAAKAREAEEAAQRQRKEEEVAAAAKQREAEEAAEKQRQEEKAAAERQRKEEESAAAEQQREADEAAARKRKEEELAAAAAAASAAAATAELEKQRKAAEEQHKKEEAEAQKRAEALRAAEEKKRKEDEKARKDKEAADKKRAKEEKKKAKEAAAAAAAEEKKRKKQLEKDAKEAKKASELQRKNELEEQKAREAQAQEVADAKTKADSEAAAAAVVNAGRAEPSQVRSAETSVTPETPNGGQQSRNDDEEALGAGAIAVGGAAGLAAYSGTKKDKGKGKAVEDGQTGADEPLVESLKPSAAVASQSQHVQDASDTSGASKRQGWASMLFKTRLGDNVPLSNAGEAGVDKSQIGKPRPAEDKKAASKVLNTVAQPEAVSQPAPVTKDVKSNRQSSQVAASSADGCALDAQVPPELLAKVQADKKASKRSSKSQLSAASTDDAQRASGLSAFGNKLGWASLTHLNKDDQAAPKPISKDTSPPATPAKSKLSVKKSKDKSAQVAAPSAGNTSRFVEPPGIQRGEYIEHVNPRFAKTTASAPAVQWR